MPEELCRNVVLPDLGRKHQIQTPACPLSSGDLLVVCESEGVLSAKLALLLGHVPVAPQEQGPQDVPSSFR